MSEANRIIINKNETKYHNMTSKTGAKSNFYPSCGKRYSTKSDFARHFRTQNAFKCQVCEKTFPRKSVLRDHINSHKGLKPYVCNVCKDGFSSRRALIDHVKNHPIEQTQPHVYDPDHYPITILTEKDDKGYECNICKKQFSKEYTIMKHLSSFTGVKGFNCELCGKGFFTNQSFESHFQTVHKDECTFTCSVCKMGFPQQDLLEGHHKSTHTPDSMPFKCKVCNSGFNMHKKLKAHMIIHIDNPTHVCLQCDKVYETKVDLRRHIKIHEDGKRRHVCQHCSARFFRKHHLERHVKRHERQDKIEEPLKNDFYQITQPQQQCHILTVNPQEIEANVNAQEIDGEVLKIQDTLETTITPVEADSKDPANNFGELAYDVVWIDSESFSTINAMDWNSLGGQRKHPEAVETASVLPAVSSRKYDNHIRTSENR